MKEDIQTILVTGGCGFIGSAVIRELTRNHKFKIVNVDKLTYAASTQSLEEALVNPLYTHINKDILDKKAMLEILKHFSPDRIMHLAAETHVDRSIDSPEGFMQTNIMGTFSLLEATRKYWLGLDENKKQNFMFHHISTDEVFGALSPHSPPFSETTSYDPRSPYSASKAASDHLVRAWYHTYGLPTLVSNTTNNYGPWQFPEKLIPLVTLNALQGKEIPVYGDGSNQRDWLYVDDHAKALIRIVLYGKAGKTYCIGAREPRSNIQIIQAICQLIDQKLPLEKGKRIDLIKFVKDRPGHDFRYEIDPSLAEQELDWHPEYSFDQGIKQTVTWYLEHQDWWQTIGAAGYCGERLGLNNKENFKERE